MEKKIDAQAFEAFVQKAFKLTAEEMASLYNDAGELIDFSLIERKDSERVAKLSTDRNNQYSRGLKEASQKFEKAIKEKYEVESELTGVELVDFIIEEKLADVSKDTGKDVMKNPEVIKLINEHNKVIKAKDKELKDKLEEKDKSINQIILLKEVKGNGLIKLDCLRPILPEDNRKAQALKEVYATEFDKYDYQKDGDSFIVLKKDGSVFQDEHGHNITFDQLCEMTANKYFDFRQSGDRSSPGNRNLGQPGQGQSRIPKNDEEYLQMMKDAKTSDERKKIMKSYRYKEKV